MDTTHRPYETQEERRPQQSVDTTVLLRRGKKIILESRGKEGSWRKRKGRKKGDSSDIGGDEVEIQRVRDMKGGV